MMEKIRWSRLALPAILLVMVISMAGCGKNEVSVAFIGDSITEGANIPYDNRQIDGYAARVQNAYGEKVKVHNYGYGGKTMISSKDNSEAWKDAHIPDATDDGASYLYSNLQPQVKDRSFYTALKKLKPQVACIMLGTNDSKTRNWDKDRFIAEYIALVDEIIGLGTKEIYLCTPPYCYSEDACDTISGKIVNTEVASAVKAVYEHYRQAGKNAVFLIDVNTATANMPGDFAGDGVHPLKGGMRAIADCILKAFAADSEYSVLKDYSVKAVTSFEQPEKPAFTKADVAKVVDYIHEKYSKDENAKEIGLMKWQRAVASMMFIHAYDVLGDKKYLDWANEELHIEYYISDDQCWGANASLELHKRGVPPKTGEPGAMNCSASYRDIFDHTLTTEKETAPIPYTGFYDSPAAGGKGGVFWGMEFDSYNTCTLAQAIVMAAQMPEQSVNGKDPRQFARQWLQIQKKPLINAETGMVYDHCAPDLSKPARGDYSYNNGTTLAALAVMARQNPEMKQENAALADKLAEYVMTYMTANDVLYSPDADGGKIVINDAHAFNGIFMHFVPYYLFADIPSKNQARFKNFVIHSANAVWKIASGKKDDYSISYAWWKPYDAERVNYATGVSGAEALLTALQVAENIKPPEYK